MKLTKKEQGIIYKTLSSLEKKCGYSISTEFLWDFLPYTDKNSWYRWKNAHTRIDDTIIYIVCLKAGLNFDDYNLEKKGIKRFRRGGRPIPVNELQREFYSKRVKAMRKKTGLTMANAAKMIPGATNSSWAKWEGGHHMPSEYRVELFCLLNDLNYENYCILPKINDIRFMKRWILKYDKFNQSFN